MRATFHAVPTQTNQEEETYTAAAVCRAARVNLATLRSWRARGIFRVEQDRGEGWTRYTESDALRVCVLAALARSGVDLTLAAQIVQGLIEFRVLKAAIDPKQRYVTISRVAFVDEPRGPRGWSYELRWAPRPSVPLDTKDESDAVGFSFDLGKLNRTAHAALKGAS